VPHRRTPDATLSTTDNPTRIPLRQLRLQLSALGTLDLHTTLSLLPLTQRTIAFSDSKNRPLANQPLQLSIYGSQENPCGQHTGFPIGRFTTNASGQITLTTPNAPLFIDNIRQVQPAPVARDERAFMLITGHKIPTNHDNIIIDLEPPNITATITTARPLEDDFQYLVHIFGPSACGANDHLQHCGPGPRLVLDSVPVHATRITITIDEGTTTPQPPDTHILSKQEIDTLITQRSLQVPWPRQ